MPSSLFIVVKIIVIMSWELTNRLHRYDAQNNLKSFRNQFWKASYLNTCALFIFFIFLFVHMSQSCWWNNFTIPSPFYPCHSLLIDYIDIREVTMTMSFLVVLINLAYTFSVRLAKHTVNLREHYTQIEIKHLMQTNNSTVLWLLMKF